MVKQITKGAIFAGPRQRPAFPCFGFYPANLRMPPCSRTSLDTTRPSASIRCATSKLTKPHRLLCTCSQPSVTLPHRTQQQAEAGGNRLPSGQRLCLCIADCHELTFETRPMHKIKSNRPWTSYIFTDQRQIALRHLTEDGPRSLHHNKR
jgi:hypothetical protein